MFQWGASEHAADCPWGSTRLRLPLTCQKVESVRLLRGVSQVAVRQTVAAFPGAVVERGQGQVLDKQLLQQHNNTTQVSKQKQKQKQKTKNKKQRTKSRQPVGSLRLSGKLTAS